MKSTTVKTKSIDGNYFKDSMQEIDESIEKMYDGEKLKW